MDDRDLKLNGSGYPDPTAYTAIKNIEREEDWKVRKLLHTIYCVCELAGFRVEGRIALKDNRTGKVWR